MPTHSRSPRESQATWATVGEYFSATDDDVPYHVAVVSWVYAIFMQVLLINLLIAMSASMATPSCCP